MMEQIIVLAAFSSLQESGMPDIDYNKEYVLEERCYSDYCFYHTVYITPSNRYSNRPNSSVGSYLEIKLTDGETQRIDISSDLEFSKLYEIIQKIDYDKVNGLVERIEGMPRTCNETLNISNVTSIRLYKDESTRNYMLLDSSCQTKKSRKESYSVSFDYNNKDRTILLHKAFEVMP